MKIRYLADHKEYIDIVNNWHFNQWGIHYPNSTRDEWLKKLKTKLNKEEVPTVFVAIKGDKPVGTASLIEEDMDTHKHYTPWLADVYVKPDYRNKGIGSKLVNRVIEETKKIGLKRLYLFTRDAKDLYLKLGWNVIETTEYNGKVVDIMVFDLS